MSVNIQRGVVMLGINGETIVARLYDDAMIAQADSAAAIRSGKYEAVILAKPYQIRRTPHALP
jgi:hypothetical protein